MPLELVFQNCCDQREPPGDEVTLHASFSARHETPGSQCTSAFTNIPEGDEALVHPSLQGEAACLTETDADKPEIPAKSSTSPDLTSFDALDAALMRGIPLRETLQWGAHLWLSDPRSLSAGKKAKLWDASKPTKKYDKFLSHTWETHGRWKQLSLLLRFGWPSMMIFWAAGAMIACVLVLLEVLPLFTVFQLPLPTLWPGVHGTSIPYGCWLMLLSSTGAILGLIVFPYLPHFASDICFLDFVCVHQTDDRKMQQGIRSIGAFLASASELRVLWSAPYLQRLWCVFELAAYRKLKPNGKIVISRVMTEVAVLLTFVWVQLVVVGFWLARSGPYGGEPWRLLLVVVCAGLPILASMSQAAVRKQDAEEELRSQLANFDVMNVKCSNEFDRQCIHDAITRWYGSMSAFNEYIQGPFCLEVLQLRRSQRGIEGHYFMFLLLPTSSYFLEGFLSIVMSGVPAEVAVSYFLAAVMCFNLIWIPSVVALGAYFTQHGVRVGRCRIKPPLLESLVIFLLCLILLAVGVAATVAGIANGIPVAILWNIVGLVFAAVTWMKCWRV